jgi:hypothetical protein
MKKQQNWIINLFILSWLVLVASFFAIAVTGTMQVWSSIAGVATGTWMYCVTKIILLYFKI